MAKKLQPRIKNEMETFGYYTSRKGQVQSVGRWMERREWRIMGHFDGVNKVRVVC